MYLYKQLSDAKLMDYHLTLQQFHFVFRDGIQAIQDDKGIDHQAVSS